ncbi:RDD family protein [Symmachiella macrocystis]|uniref:RDD family protein n=1 Tax=Symmachiella macrocystis TaxID=2527985 RepID=A0A5C6BP49_9PLAN|nr:RDD family protein [Symmachiella macrocystis]TWU13046.1 RDD family protein [Symmachiella macrocystis]
MSSLDLTSSDVPAIVELHSAIETPENVVLTYRLAGPALRLWAYVIDTVIRGIVLFVAAIVAEISEMAIEGVPMGLWLVLLFLMEWGYFAIFEGFFRGKTIGKHAMSIRVIQEAGYPISFWSALMRNFLRAADMIPLYGIGFISAFTSGKFRRLGDLAAGTVVIEERKVQLPREPIILEKIQPLSRTDIGTYVPPHKTLTLIEEFLQRRFVVTHQRGHELAARLAAVLAKKLNFQGEANFVEEYPMAFLARVYVTFHRTMNNDADEIHDHHPDQRQQAVAGEAMFTSP